MVEWLLAHQGVNIYIILFLALIGGALGLPIPEDVPLVAAGIAVHQATVRPDLAFLVCYVGVVLGDVIIFSVGRKFGPALFRKRWFQSRISPSKIRYLRANLERRAVFMIFIARHMFYLRTVTFLTCGAVRMRYSRFLIADAIAALVSAPIMMFLGYLGSEHFEEIFAAIGKTKNLLMIIGAVGIVGYILYRRYRNRVQQQEEAEWQKDTAVVAEVEQEAPPLP